MSLNSLPRQTQSKVQAALPEKQKPVPQEMAVCSRPTGASRPLLVAANSPKAIEFDWTQRETVRVLAADDMHGADRLNTLAPFYFTLNQSGTILAITASGLERLGYTMAEVVGQPVVNLLHLQDRPHWEREFAAVTSGALDSGALDSGAGSIEGKKFRLVCANGQMIEQAFTLQICHTSGVQPLLLLVCQAVESGQSVTSQLVEREEQHQISEMLRQQAEWKRLIRAIAQLDCQALNLKQILHTAATEVRHILQTDRVLIYQFHPQEVGNLLAEALSVDSLSVLESSEVITHFEKRYFPLNNLIELQIISNLEHYPPTSQALKLLRHLAVKSEVIVPVFQYGVLWGLLIVHQCQYSRQWQQWELDLLNQLAIHLEGVIHQAELYQQVQRLNADLERQIQARTAQLQLAFEFEATLKRITDKVRDSLEEDQILETAVEELVRAIGVSCCNASLYDLDEGTSTVRYEYDMTASPYHGRTVQLDAFPELYDQLLQGRSFQFCSLVFNPTRGRTAIFTCPIVDDQGVLGDLWLVNQSFYGFSEQDIRLVQQVANQCAIAIRQARLYQAAQAQVEELERLNRLKDDFLSTVSHELRTPMTNIKIAAQMLEVALKQEQILAEENPRIVRYFKILQAECQREINLINDLLDLSRLDADHESLHLTAIDLSSWVTRVAQPFFERTQNHQQRLHIHVDPALPLLTTDASHLERIIGELLMNACKYTPIGETISISAQLGNESAELVSEGSGVQPNSKQVESFENHNSLPTVRFHARSQSHLQPVPNTIRIQVANSGVEIPAQELPHVFEKFYRIPNNDPWQHGGTGLGLALVKKLVEHLGGMIQVESGSECTCFRVELPLHPIEDC